MSWFLQLRFTGGTIVPHDERVIAGPSLLTRYLEEASHRKDGRRRRARVSEPTVEFDAISDTCAAIASPDGHQMCRVAVRSLPRHPARLRQGGNEEPTNEGGTKSS